MKYFAVPVLLFAASAASAQTKTQTNCTTRTDDNGVSKTDCTSTNTTAAPAGAVKGVTDALNNRPRVDWDALQRQKDAKNERRFEQDKNGIEQIRANYLINSGGVLPKDTIKAFNHYRRDVCKVQKWLPHPVALDNMLRDLDGTPRSCREVAKIK